MTNIPPIKTKKLIGWILYLLIYWTIFYFVVQAIQPLALTSESYTNCVNGEYIVKERIIEIEESKFY